MANGSSALPPQIQAWVEAWKRYHLSHAHAQMARELGLNPRKLGKIANHRQEPWKAPHTNRLRRAVRAGRQHRAYDGDAE